MVRHSVARCRDRRNAIDDVQAIRSLMNWMGRLQYVWHIHISLRRRCQGEMRVSAVVIESGVIMHIHRGPCSWSLTANEGSC